MFGRLRAQVLTIWVAAALLIAPGAAFGQAQDQSAADPRLFAQTGYRVDRDAFWDYFTRRGGVTTFGYP